MKIKAAAQVSTPSADVGFKGGIRKFEDQTWQAFVRFAGGEYVGPKRETRAEAFKDAEDAAKLAREAAEQAGIRCELLRTQ